MVDIAEIEVRSALARSKIPGVEYVINPYVGCEHGCRYCYADFMAKWSRSHAGWSWGSFVEVKVNIVSVLRTELRRKRRRAGVLLSSVCDPYQPVEERYRLTRQCLLCLGEHGWGMDVLTRSPLVKRDLDILSAASDASVGLSIPTDDDGVRHILEPNSPAIPSRLETLRDLHQAGIKTWVFIGPMLPMNAEKLHEAVAPYVEHVLIDRLNYGKKVAALFREHGWGRALTDEYALETESTLANLFGDKARVV